MPSAKMPRPGRVSDALLKRRIPIKRTAPPKRSTKRIPRVNAERKAKRLKRYRSFLASAKWKQLRKAALERAENQCEEWFDMSRTYQVNSVYKGAHGLIAFRGLVVIWLPYRVIASFDSFTAHCLDGLNSPFSQTESATSNGNRTATHLLRTLAAFLLAGEPGGWA